MKYLFFDTETTGTPKNYKAPMQDVDNWPRVLQLAFILYDENGNVLESFESLIKPDGWEVPDGVFWAKHGYTTEKCQTNGVSMQEALSKFIELYEQCDMLVAHNISFDYNVLGAEMLRYNVKTSARKDKICTMHSTTDFVALPGNYGFKWPKLEELYYKLFGEIMEGAHDALFDVKATAKCFFELKKINVL